MSPHRLRRAALAAVVSSTVILSACSASGDAAEGSSSADELVIAFDRDYGPVNLFTVNNGFDQLVELVYDKLFAPSPYVDQVQPWLATEARNIDSSTWEVDLRTDVTWQDGEPFTADDVIFTYGYMREVKTGRFTHHVTDTPNIERVVAVDADTVRFECGGHCPSLAAVTLADLPIIPKHIWSKIDPAEALTVTDLPVGTGPYELTSHSATAGYEFEANPDYFMGAPRVEKLTIPIISDQSATFTALRSGEIDATIRATPPELREQFDKDDNLSTHHTTDVMFPELRLNFFKKPLADPDFRKALSDAIDKEQMLEVIGLGQGEPATKGYPHPSAPFANPENSTPTDRANAEKILDRLDIVDSDGDGIREQDGKNLELVILVNSGLPQDVAIADLVAEDLKKVGIGARTEGFDAATLVEKTSVAPAERDYDMSVALAPVHGVLDSDQFIMSHRSGYLGSTEVGWPAYDAAYEKWLDEETRAGQLEVMLEMQAIHNATPTTIPLYYPAGHFTTSTKYNGWFETPGYGIFGKWSFLDPEVVEAAHSDEPGTVVLP